MLPLPTLFAAITTLLASRAGDGRMVPGTHDERGPEAEAREDGEVHPLERTRFGQFVVHELRPFSEALLGSTDMHAFELQMDELVDGGLGDRLFHAALTIVQDGWGEEDADAEEDLGATLAALRARIVEAVGGRHANAVHDAFGTMMSMVAQMPAADEMSEAVEAVAQTPLSELLSDVEAPLERRQSMLAAVESSACYFALLQLVAAPRALPPWLTDELVRRWASGQAEGLRTLRRSTDLDALAMQDHSQRMVNDSYELLARRGAIEGAEVWPPGVGDDD